jgi:RNA polymerase sigma-70 factor (ECF subfamily)
MGTLSLAVHAKPIHMIPPPAFTELYQRYSETVYRTALRITGAPPDAEDALQTVFLRVLRQGSLSGEPISEKYFRRAAANAAIDILRRRISKAEAQLDESLPQSAPESPVLLKEQLRRALATLLPQDAELFILRYVEGLSNGELAVLFGITKPRVALRLFRIRRTLQTEMQR